MKRRESLRFVIFALLVQQSSALSLLSASKAVLQSPGNLWRFINASGKGELPEEGDLTFLVEGWPAKNFWGHLKTTPSRYGEDNGGALYLPAPGKELTNVERTVTQMCATISSLLYDTNKGENATENAALFYRAIEEQAQPNFDSKLKQHLERVCSIQEEVHENGTVNFSRIGAQKLETGCGCCSPPMPCSNCSIRGTGLDKNFRIFDDHGPLKQVMPPMATAVLGDTMIIAWRGSVRRPSQPSPPPRSRATPPRPASLSTARRPPPH